MNKTLNNSTSSTLSDEKFDSYLISSKYKFDNSSVIVDISKWDDYVSFLCTSLGLTSEDNINQIKNIKFIESNKLALYDFHVEFRHDDMYFISLIKLYYRKLCNTNKLSIYFTRAKTDHKFSCDIVDKIKIIDELRHGFEQYNDEIIESLH